MAKYQSWPIGKWFQMLSNFEIGLTYKIESRI